MSNIKTLFKKYQQDTIFSLISIVIYEIKKYLSRQSKVLQFFNDFCIYAIHCFYFLN